MNFKIDIKEYSGNAKDLILILLFGMSSFCTRTIFARIIGFPITLLYRVVFEFVHVIKDMPSNCLVAGNPAKVLKYF